MAIEFRCTQCDRLLRTPDSTGGKQARCPECGAIIAIPWSGGVSGDTGATVPPAAAQRSPLAPGGPHPGAAADSENQYAAPSEYAAAGTGAAPDYAQPAAGFVPTVIDLGDIFSRTWTIFKDQWGTCLVALIVVWLLSFVVNIVVGVGCKTVGSLADDKAVAAMFVLLGNVATTLFSVWIGIGQALYFLKVARGQAAELVDIFTGGPYLWRVLGASILFGLICLVGYVLCIVPGVIFALMFSQYYFLILDRNVGVMDSLNVSKEIMTGNKLTLFLIGLVAAGAGILIVLCTCGIGLLAVAPFFALLGPVIYLAVTGQPTADQHQLSGTRD